MANARKISAALLAALVTLCSAPQAAAQSLSLGSYLKERPAPNVFQRPGQGNPYMLGVIEMVTALNASMNGAYPFCSAKQIGPAEADAALNRWITNTMRLQPMMLQMNPNSAQYKMPLAKAVREALSAAYPCRTVPAPYGAEAKALWYRLQDAEKQRAKVQEQLGICQKRCTVPATTIKR